VGRHAVPEDFPDQEEAGQEDEAEPPHSALDPHADRQHHPLQCQAEALAQNQAWSVGWIRVWRRGCSFGRWLAARVHDTCVCLSCGINYFVAAAFVHIMLPFFTT